MNPVKLVFIAGIALAGFIVDTACAGTGVAVSVTYQTGDNDFDSHLRRVSEDGDRDRNAFAARISLDYNVPRAKVDYMMVNLNMTPGDVYMAVGIALILGRPVDIVYTSFHKNRKKGWGAIAKELGIKPGSAEFHRLKRGEFHAAPVKKENQSGVTITIQSNNAQGDQGKGHGKGGKLGKKK